MNKRTNERGAQASNESNSATAVAVRGSAWLGDVRIGEMIEVIGVEDANAVEAHREKGKWVLVMHMKRKDKSGSEYPVFIYRLWEN